MLLSVITHLPGSLVCDITSQLFLRFSIMASGGPVVNGDISRSPIESGTLEETLQQMSNLIQENRDLIGE